MLEGWRRVDVAASATLPSLRCYLRTETELSSDEWTCHLRAFLAGGDDRFEEVLSSKAAVVRRIELDGRTYFFKRFLLRGIGDRLKHLVRPSRAARAVFGGELVAEHGFRAPRAVALVELRRFGVVVGSAFVTEAIEGAPDLKQWLGDDPSLGMLENWPEKRRLVRALAREVGSWHAAGLYHGDMRFGNILCRIEGEEYVFFWLDNERNRRFESLPFAARLKNLEQLNVRRRGVSLTDRLRFWRLYRERAGVDPRRYSSLLRAIQEKTRRRWAKWGWLETTGSGSVDT